MPKDFLEIYQLNTKTKRSIICGIILISLKNIRRYYSQSIIY